MSRPRGYKGAELLIEAFRKLPDHRLVVVGSDSIKDCPTNVTCLGAISDAQIRWLYARARALVSVSREDFGLTPIEANAFGTPVLVLRAGGFLDSTREGVSGHFIGEASIDEIVRAVTDFPKDWNRGAILAHADLFNASSFSKRIHEIIEKISKT